MGSTTRYIPLIEANVGDVNSLSSTFADQAVVTDKPNGGGCIATIMIIL